MVPLRRRWLWLAGAVALVVSLASSPGQVAPDTKLDLTAAPLRFLVRAANLWNSDLPFGQTQNQAYGYLFPQGTFFLLGDLAGLPGWVSQRLWWAALLTVGFAGMVRLAEALSDGHGIGSPTSRVIGAVAFALSPRVLTTLGSISSETLPMMLAPWALLPVIRALRGDPARSARMLAGQAAAAVALMGAVNAVATLAGLLPSVIWWACHRPNRLWWRFTGWWVFALSLATLWWLVPLLLLSRVSPPFLDFIESSGVTTQWTSLVEVLRGTHSWTPFVAPNATAGAPLVTRPVLILGTTLVAAAGVAGLAGLLRRRTPGAGRLVAMLLIGVTLLAAGYADGLGSPLAEPARAFLDGAGAPLRNVHKLESLIRIPLALGLVHLLGRVSLPGSAPAPEWRRAFSHPEHHKPAAVGLVVLVALLVSTSLAWTGRLAPTGTFDAIPQHWRDTADWLARQNTGTPVPGRILVVPGAPFATQTWGTSHDEPLQVLGETGVGPWGVRDSIPLTPPETIRALDSVQQLLAAGRPSAGLADTLTRQGISYLVLRNDLDPDMSRSTRPILAHRTVDRSPGLVRVAQFGELIAAGAVEGFVSDSGLRPGYPAVEIYRVLNRGDDPAGAVGNPGAPYLVDADRLARVDGGPEVLLRLDEQRRLRGLPPLGPVLLTADARRAGLATPTVTVTDTPLAREIDYGRVDHHSSATRAVGDPRHTHNRVPDYPVAGADTAFGGWIGGRVTTSSSSADASTLPDVAPAASAAAATDGDPTTAWVSNALQTAVGQWLQVDFDHPVTNGTISVTPSATAVGAQVRRIQISTPNGTSTLRFDRAGEPLTTALPYGETGWVRVTAIGTDDDSPGVQFGITEMSVTQYDASGLAHPVDLQHTVLVPSPPPGADVDQWNLGSGLPGRPGCAPGPDGVVRCAASMMLDAEEPAGFSRALAVSRPTSVTPTLWLRARPGPGLADLAHQPGAVRAHGDADLLDVPGSAYAAADGDPATAWTAPQRVTAARTPPTLTLTLPRPTEVTGVRITPARSPVPTRPTLVAVDLGAGPQVREVADGETATLRLQPRITDTVTVSILDWIDVIDRTALGFDQLKPPGLAEVAVLGAGDRPVAPPDAGRNRDRTVTVDCDRGPVISIAGRIVHTRVVTTVGALLAGEPVAAQLCDPRPILLPARQQELLVSPGAAFVVDGVQLVNTGPAGRSVNAGTPAVTSAATVTWTPALRRVRVRAAPTARLLVVPESINPGWVARAGDGTPLAPIAVNGWQQGWLVPAGTDGTVTVTFASNRLYRAALAGGLGLLPVLGLLACWPGRRRDRAGHPVGPVRPWLPPRWLAVAATLGVGAVISGAAGLAVFGAMLGVLHSLRHRDRVGDTVVLWSGAGGLITAGAVLSRHPWRSVDGYAGHSAAVQLLALVSVAALAGAAALQHRPDRR